MALVRKILETTLTAGSTSVSFSDSAISNSLLRVYSTNENVFPISQSLTGNVLTVSYEVQSSNMGVALEIVKQGLEIIDDLTSDDTDKALSAKQGKTLKALIDQYSIPDLTDLPDVKVTNIQNNQVLAWSNSEQKFVNVSQGGGDTVTITPTFSSGTKIADYSINSESGSLYAPLSSEALDDLTDVTITNVQNGQILKYNSTMQKWENSVESAGGGSTIKITTSDSTLYGETITLSDGTTTLTTTFSNSGEATFSGVTMTGSLTLVCEECSMTVNVPYFGNYEFELRTIPEGSTVLPTDDIQTWLACAGITDKSYTTLNEVLADSTTLLALISNNNASDYLVRSTTWASGITADSTAMTDIGANNYCANTLLSDSTWLNAICNSTYFESVLNTKVPTMTSDTTPSGEASASSLHGTAAWKVFDSDESSNSYWEAGSNTNQWIAYDFQSLKKIAKVMILPLGSQYSPKNAKIQAYINNDWVDLKSIVCNDSFTKQYFILDALATSEKFRIYCIDNYGKNYVDICQVQFYCRADV